jgi:hypothetical protein
MWNTSQLYTAGLLRVALSGDYNFDGSVDAADYVVWRKTDGSQEGYDTWRAHFGETAGSGSGATASANAAVPEPTALGLLLFTTLLHIARRSASIT